MTDPSTPARQQRDGETLAEWTERCGKEVVSEVLRQEWEKYGVAAPPQEAAKINSLTAEFDAQLAGMQGKREEMEEAYRFREAGREPSLFDQACRFEQLREPRPQTNREIWDMMADFAAQVAESRLSTVAELLERMYNKRVLLAPDSRDWREVEAILQQFLQPVHMPPPAPLQPPQK